MEKSEAHKLIQSCNAATLGLHLEAYASILHIFRTPQLLTVCPLSSFFVFVIFLHAMTEHFLAVLKVAFISQTTAFSVLTLSIIQTV